jgi:hypothetical protein
METLYFTLGIASVVVIAVAIGAVWAMFKVAKLTQSIQDLERSVIDELNTAHRDLTMVEQTIMNQINHSNRDLDDKFNDVYRQIDSRVDKLAARQEKQLING